jgi:hypothetical protein
MKLFCLALVAIFLTAALLSHAAYADAQGVTDMPAFTHETPLMVIRFNQTRVDYPTPLYNTIGAALKAKPSAVFDLVSIAPRAREEHNQSYYDHIAEQNTHKVLSTLHEIGLPANRISLTNAVDNVDASEVRIYVH